MVFVPSEALNDRLRIAFVHIPKTGGNSFREYLRRQFQPCRDAVLNSADAVAKFHELPAPAKLAFDLVSGHFPYGFDLRLPRRFRYFTCLREPVQRVVSNYNYMMSGEPQNVLAKRLRSERWSLRDFATTTDPDGMARLFAQLTYLGIHPASNKTTTLAGLCEQAVVNIVSQFEFVGCLELMDESVVYMHERYGFDLAPAPVKNQTPGAHRKGVSDDDLALLRERMAPEVKLYEVAKRILQERLSTIENLAEKVKSMRTQAVANTVRSRESVAGQEPLGNAQPQPG